MAINNLELEIETSSSAAFTEELLKWNAENNRRAMPWKGIKDPYKIWLSEIILQQTRVEQGLKYYQNFVRTYPTVNDLSRAPETEVFKLWEGLGYYSRCRNLITTAKFIASQLGGRFPETYEDILALKGVGDYTAAAIASFAYNLPHAVLDGNVFRVLSRIFQVHTPIDSTKGKKLFSALAQSLLPKGKADQYNQAIMDFGAGICKPVPLCKECFFKTRCLAFVSGTQDVLPVKEKKLKTRDRWFNYLVLTNKDEVAVRQRLKKDIWQQLFEFILIETDSARTDSDILDLFSTQITEIKQTVKIRYTAEQKLSHQNIKFLFLVVDVASKPALDGYTWIKHKDLARCAFPKTLQKFSLSLFQKNSTFPWPEF